MNFQALAHKAGVIFDTGFDPKEFNAQAKAIIAMDAQSVPVTSPNAGVPSLFTTYVDPKVIEVLLTPTPLAEAFGEVKKGSWTDQTLMFALAESSGQVASYGDFNENGMSDTNVNYEERNPYHYQSIIRVGDREAAIAGAANLNWVERKQIASVTALNRFQNKSYIFGVSGLKNYGLINDPELFPNITPTAWGAKSALQIFGDIQALYALLVKQTDGLVDRTTKMTLVLPPQAEANFVKTNDFGLNVSDMLDKNFPNLKIVVVPEYTTATGHQLQLIADSYDGQPTVELSFTEKLRVFPIVLGKSGFDQKRMQGTNGAIVYRPLMIAGALVSLDPP
jgi:hypothetical protein